MSPSSELLHYLRYLAASLATDERSDADLLAEFVERQDERSFTVLVARHGTLVWRVCRGLIKNDAEAEDAFQATFFQLAKKANQLRRGNLGGWLHHVARQTALKLRAAGERRHRLEGQIRDLAAQKSESADAQPDLYAVLNEELAELPERLRIPLLLRYLEGKTLAEVARLLGVTIRAVVKRLERGESILREKLTGRGIVVGAIGALVAASGSASAISPRLVMDTSRAALAYRSGTLDGHAADIAKRLLLEPEGGVSSLPRLFLAAVHRPGWLVTAGMVLSLLGGVVWAYGAWNKPRPELSEDARDHALPDRERGEQGAGRSGANGAPEPAPNKQTAESAEAPIIEVAGRVVDAKGKPLPAASVALFDICVRAGQSTIVHSEECLVVGQTDSEGRFRLTTSTAWLAPLAHDRHLKILASAHGLAPGSQRIGSRADNQAIELKLEEIEPISGQVVNQKGQPVAGVRIRVAGIGDVGPLTARATQALKVPFWPRTVESDAQGRFSLGDVNRQQVIWLETAGENIGLQWTRVPQQSGQAGPITITTSPPQMLAGSVIAQDTGKPLAGAKVVLLRSDGQDMNAHYFSETRTDEMGRFQLQAASGATTTVVIAQPPEGQPYLSCLKGDIDSWSEKAPHLEFQLARGIQVRGTVSDAKTGRPVPDVLVQFSPESKDTKFRPFRPDATVVGSMAAVRGDRNGHFTLPVLPGPGHVLVIGPGGDYMAAGAVNGWDVLGPGYDGVPYLVHGMANINLTPDSENPALQIRLHSGVSLSGIALLPDGKPANQRLLVYTPHVAFGSWLDPTAIPVRDGRFSLHGCDPSLIYSVYLFDPDNQCGAVARLAVRDDTKPEEVRLIPCGLASTRYRGPEGKPLVGYHPQLSLMVDMPFSLQQKAAGRLPEQIPAPMLWPLLGGKPNEDPRSNSRGQATLPCLIPGARYQIGRFTKQDVWRGYQEFEAKSGQIVTVPEIVPDPPG